MEQRVILTSVKKSARFICVRDPYAEQPAFPFWRLVDEHRVVLDVRINLEDRSVDWHFYDPGILDGLDCGGFVSLAKMNSGRR
jgi:hypothetical protein